MNNYTPLKLDTIQKIYELHNSGPVKEVSSGLMLIASVIMVFGAVGGIGYYAYKSALAVENTDRTVNALLYQNPNDVNILGAEDVTTTSTLPDVDIQAPAGTAQNSKPQERTQTSTFNGQKIPPKPTSPPKPTVEPSVVPEDSYSEENSKFSFVLHGFKNKKFVEADANGFKTITSNDGTYTLHFGAVKNNYPSVQDYLDSNPHGRQPKNGVESVTVDGLTGKKTKRFEIEVDGSRYTTMGLYLVSADSESIYILELDSTVLDVNSNGLRETFDTLISTFKQESKK